MSDVAAINDFVELLLAGENTADGYVIDLGDGNTLTLTGVVEADLEEGFFIF